MALRRPHAPRLQSGRPGADPPPVAPELAPEKTAPQLAPTNTAAPRLAPEPMPVSAPDATLESTPGLRPGAASEAAPAAHGTGASRRIVVAAGAVLAVGGIGAGGVFAVRRVLGGDATSSRAQRAADTGAADAATASALFADVAGDDPDIDAITWAHEHGVQPALADGSYAPDAEMTRADLARALHAFGGSPQISMDPVPELFADLPADPVTASALLWLHGRGAAWGDDDMQVRPDDPATRDDAAGMVAALLRPGLRGLGVEVDTPTTVPFEDLVPDDSHDVLWLLGAGLLGAQQRTRWDGEQPLRRREVAALLHSVQELLEQRAA